MYSGAAQGYVADVATYQQRSFRVIFQEVIASFAARNFQFLRRGVGGLVYIRVGVPGTHEATRGIPNSQKALV